MVTENGHQRLANHKIRPFKNTIWPLGTQDEQPGPGFRPCRQQVDHNAKPNQDHAQSKNHDRYLEEHFNPFSYDFFPNFVRPSRRYYVVRGLRLLCFFVALFAEYYHFVILTMVLYLFSSFKWYLTLYSIYYYNSYHYYWKWNFPMTLSVCRLDGWWVCRLFGFHDLS